MAVPVRSPRVGALRMYGGATALLFLLVLLSGCEEARGDSSADPLILEMRALEAEIERMEALYKQLKVSGAQDPAAHITPAVPSVAVSTAQAGPAAADGPLPVCPDSSHPASQAADVLEHIMTPAERGCSAAIGFGLLKKLVDSKQERCRPGGASSVTCYTSGPMEFCHYRNVQFNPADRQITADCDLTAPPKNQKVKKGPTATDAQNQRAVIVVDDAVAGEGPPCAALGALLNAFIAVEVTGTTDPTQVLYIEGGLPTGTPAGRSLYEELWKKIFSPAAPSVALGPESGPVLLTNAIFVAKAADSPLCSAQTMAAGCVKSHLVHAFSRRAMNLMGALTPAPRELLTSLVVGVAHGTGGAEDGREIAAAIEAEVRSKAEATTTVVVAVRLGAGADPAAALRTLRSVNLLVAVNGVGMEDLPFISEESTVVVVAGGADPLPYYTALARWCNQRILHYEPEPMSAVSIHDVVDKVKTLAYPARNFFNKVGNNCGLTCVM